MFLRISNNGTVDRRFFELVGFGTKRGTDSADVIGERSTGAKLAAIAALRLGLSLAICSADAKGRYVLTYETEKVTADETASEQIVLVYRMRPHGPVTEELAPVKERKPWSFTVDSFMDWDEPIGNDDNRSFKTLREFLCNARDADPSWTWDLQEHVRFAPEGRTEVYVEFSEEIERILSRHPDRYLKFLAEEARYHEVEGHGRIYEKSESGKTRLFHRGVLVGCEKPMIMSSSYDYSLVAKGLVSEDRIIKSASRFGAGVGQMLASVTNVEMVSILFNEMVVERRARYEAAVLERVKTVPETSAKAWREAVAEHYGTELVCLESGNMQADADAEQVYGYRLARNLPSGLKSFLRVLGYPSAKDVTPNLPEVMRIRFDDLEEESRNRFMEAFRLCAKYFPKRAKMPIVFFYVEDEKIRKRVYGYASGKDAMTEIWIACETPTRLLGDASVVFKTLVHEGRHVESGAGDYDRRFMQMAENDVVSVILRAEHASTDLSGNPVAAQEFAPIAPSFLPVGSEPPDGAVPSGGTDDMKDADACVAEILRRYDEEK